MSTSVQGARLPSALVAQVRSWRYVAIWPATAALFAISPALSSGSLTGSWFVSMLPFAAILAVAAIGQTLVIQQRGLDLSVPGMITLSTIVVTKYPNGSESKLPVGILLALLVCVGAGLLSGIAVTRFGITPLVATLGVNALLLGAVYQITSGAATSTSVPSLGRFAVGKSAGIPNTVIVAVPLALVVAAAIRTSVAGRRFVAVGASPAAARAAGIPVRGYQVATYMVAGLMYGGAGILLAGYLSTPGISGGNDFLLPTIAAVVLGGTSLAGGAGSVVATAIGALFLTQLDQVMSAMGGSKGVQYITQGAIIAIGMALRYVPWQRLRERLAPAAPWGSPGLVEGGDS
jgi:ribose transport system permease protein